MIIIIQGPQGSGKTTLAKLLHQNIMKPAYPEIIEGLPRKPPKGLKVEGKIYTTQEETLPKWVYTSNHILLISLQ